MDGKHEDSAASNFMVPSNLRRIARYFRSLLHRRPTATEMGKLVFDAGHPAGGSDRGVRAVRGFEAGDSEGCL